MCKEADAKREAEIQAQREATLDAAIAALDTALERVQACSREKCKSDKYSRAELEKPDPHFEVKARKTRMAFMAITEEGLNDDSLGPPPSSAEHKAGKLVVFRQAAPEGGAPAPKSASRAVQ